jgi:hypothetical protein
MGKPSPMTMARVSPVSSTWPQLGPRRQWTPRSPFSMRLRNVVDDAGSRSSQPKIHKLYDNMII